MPGFPNRNSILAALTILGLGVSLCASIARGQQPLGFELGPAGVRGSADQAVGAGINVQPISYPAHSLADRAVSALRRERPVVESLFEPAQGSFPILPPDPYAHEYEPLAPLSDELLEHRGSYLYSPEGDLLDPYGQRRKPPLRLPENWIAPEPFTLFSDFLGADPIRQDDSLRWFNGRYAWHPEFVGYGSLEVFGGGLQQNGRRQDFIGHQLILDMDLRLTGTERFHVQFRPTGDGASGGSFYRFSDPEGYVNNGTAEPQRYWFEGELHSMLGSWADPFAPSDFHVVAGKFPFQLHNNFLMNDEVIGVAVNKNTLFVGDLSNLNVQLFYAFNDVDTFENADGELFGVHLSADRNRTFYEATYARVDHAFDTSRRTHYGAVSRTQLVGSLTLAGRALFKWGDEGGRGDGQLYVLESNLGRYFDGAPLGVESAVFYANAFSSSRGWNSIGAANFNRVRTAFEVDPTIRIAAGPAANDTLGVALGVQLFRHHQDESITPEIAFEAPGGEAVWGAGLRYQRKTGPRSYIEALGVINISDDPQFERDGVLLSWFLLF